MYSKYGGIILKPFVHNILLRVALCSHASFQLPRIREIWYRQQCDVMCMAMTFCWTFWTVRSRHYVDHSRYVYSYGLVIRRQTVSWMCQMMGGCAIDDIIGLRILPTFLMQLLRRIRQISELSSRNVSYVPTMWPLNFCDDVFTSRNECPGVKHAVIFDEEVYWYNVIAIIDNLFIL